MAKFLTYYFTSYWQHTSILLDTSELLFFSFENSLAICFNFVILPRKFFDSRSYKKVLETERHFIERVFLNQILGANAFAHAGQLQAVGLDLKPKKTVPEKHGKQYYILGCQTLVLCQLVETDRNTWDDLTALYASAVRVWGFDTYYPFLSLATKIYFLRQKFTAFYVLWPDFIFSKDFFLHINHTMSI